VSDSTDFDVLIPFLEHLGLRLLEIGGGRARVRFDPKPEHLNSWKAIHGGGVMTVLDAALSSACRSLDEECVGATTVELKVNFIGAARGAVIAEGRAQRAGARCSRRASCLIAKARPAKATAPSNWCIHRRAARVRRRHHARAGAVLPAFGLPRFAALALALVALV
jgi:uncharacterized protein (TIGR00369 family)